MSAQDLQFFDPRPSATVAPQQRPQPHQPQRSLGRHLINARVITDQELLRALVLQQHQKAPLDHILWSQGYASRDQLLEATSHQYGLHRVDLSNYRPNTRLLSRRPAGFWLQHCALPWRQLDGLVLIAIAQPEGFAQLQQALSDSFPNLKPVLASEAQISALLAAHFRQDLALAANTRVAQAQSCRHWRSRSGRRWLPQLAAVTLATLALFAPLITFTALCALSLLVLALFSALKMAGFVTHLAHKGRIGPPPSPARAQRRPKPLPRISVLVPLYHEAGITMDLLRRLNRLTYPKSLLEVLLVLEEHDQTTRAALSKVRLPRWMRIIEVPQHGALTTKPRAMNYALDFCHGEIIGVWDAEDAPAPGQLERVAQTFEQADPEVACLQGVLDYYNARRNWIARCFTLEYASWFRIVLPGLTRLGLVIPLGGTTLFVKRQALDRLGGWDAHNVTEDADLGVRLCRAGYRTEMIATTTHEEATCSPWPWIRQRSRWLKGFMLTYMVHMRQPRLLLAQLGWKRFLGFHAFFLGSVGQFLLAPFLWSFWLLLLGLPHPSATVVPLQVLHTAATALVMFELLSISLSIMAAFASNRRDLALWAPTMMLYFPLGVFAAYKALHELVWRPFFWDKTTHGSPATVPVAPDSATA